MLLSVLCNLFGVIHVALLLWWWGSLGWMGNFDHSSSCWFEAIFSNTIKVKKNGLKLPLESRSYYLVWVIESVTYLLGLRVLLFQFCELHSIYLGTSLSFSINSSSSLKSLVLSWLKNIRRELSPFTISIKLHIQWKSKYVFHLAWAILQSFQLSFPS